MFDAISVSERNRRPWTVVVSFIGQVAMVGLAIVIPLLSTEVLPRRLGWVTVPEPPRGRPPRPAHAAVTRANAVPSQVYRRFLIQPASVPQRVLAIVDPAPLSSADDGPGVVGGIGGAGGSGGSVIDSILSNQPAAAPPPAVARKEEVKPAKRITVGGLVQAARLLSGPAPVYPRLARDARIEGVVRLEAIISRDGTIMGLRAVSGHPLLIPAAIAAVERWVFRPTILDGDPVEVATQIDVRFTLQR